MLILGLDGGGSNARMEIASVSGEVIFKRLARGVNPMDNELWQANYDELLSDAGALLHGVKVAVLGLPGWGEVPRLDRHVAAYLKGRLPCKLCLMNDVELAHRAAFDDGAGVLLLSGTGSMAIGKTGGSAFIRAGGYGDLIGDEGSAYDIGRRALALLACELDGRQTPTQLGKSLQEFLQLGNENAVQALTTWLYGQTHARSAIASVAAFTDQCAETGDQDAKALISQAARDLARHYMAIVERLERKDLPWSYAGSTFKSGLFRMTVESAIGSSPAEPLFDALAGALRIAGKIVEQSER
jgi:glucosamine kinase